MLQDTETIQTYLERKSGQKVHIAEMRELGGEATDSEALKQFGYGRPLLITYQAEGQKNRVVLHRSRILHQQRKTMVRKTT